MQATSSSSDSNAEIRGQSVLMLGHGREGRSAIAYLRGKYPDLRLGIADAKAIDVSTLPQGVQIHSGPDYLDAIAAYDTVVRSPGIRPDLPELLAAAPVKQITSLTNLFMECCPGTVIAVTGTKGKSTTSSLIAHLLGAIFPDVRLVGNIGNPALDRISDATESSIFVLELSSFQLADLKRAPQVAVMLNIVPEHLDYHGTFDAYRDAKARITILQDSTQLLVCNPANQSLAPVLAATKAAKLFFRTSGQPEDAAVFNHDGAIHLQFGNRALRWIEHSELPVRGPGNIENVSAAVALALDCGMQPEMIRERLKSFKPLAHRLEPVGIHRGIQFYNDSLATIPEATINALTALGPAVHTLICGGHDRGLEYGVLADELCSSNVKTLILFPVTGKKILDTCVARCSNFLDGRTVFHINTMEEAVRKAYEATPPGAICLLSPAASSLNLFRDYQDRGEQFRRCIEAQ